VPEPRHARGLIDTSAVIDLDALEPARLPTTLAISALTLAELACGPHASSDETERARRQDRLQQTEATFEPLPFDAAYARAYCRLYAVIASAGQQARGARALDLQIGATALAHELPLYTLNVGDLRCLEGALEVIDARLR